jgi:VanZ family protein
MNKQDESSSIKFDFKWRLIFSVPAVILTIAIFIVSDMSQPPYIDLGFDFTDKILHALAYFGYGTCLTAFYVVNFQNWSKRALLIGIILFGALYGVSDEFHQYFVPGRDCDIFDWLADLTGILISISLFKFIKNIISKIVKSVNG